MEDGVLIDEAKAHIGFSKALHEEQYVCLEAVVCRKDVLAVLPTGFGKSLIYQLVPFVISLQRGVPLTATKLCFSNHPSEQYHDRSVHGPFITGNQFLCN